MNTKDLAEEIVVHLRKAGCLDGLGGGDVACLVMRPIKEILSKNLSNHVGANELLDKLAKIPGGYTYSGACSYQVCFPLADGGELRLMLVDEQDKPMFGETCFCVDKYDGSLPPGITGPASKTG